jgi:hypothetical protein
MIPNATRVRRDLAAWVAVLAGCSGGASGTGADSAEVSLLSYCAVPSTWVPASADPRDAELVSTRHCRPVREEDPCVMPEGPTPAPGACDRIREIVCYVSFIGRTEFVRDTYRWRTEGEARDRNFDECCYSVIAVPDNSVCGRPFRCLGVVTRAAGELPDDPVAARWWSDALDEHASIAAFAQLALDLMAHGAPARLIEATRRAMEDEVEHARAAFAITSRRLGRRVEPGPLPMKVNPAPTLRELAVQTAIDGGVGESVATLTAAIRRARATEPDVCAALERVMADELEHAALAWEIVAWAVERGGDEVRLAVEAALAEVRPTAPDEAVDTDWGLPGGAELRRAVGAWGRVGPT